MCATKSSLKTERKLPLFLDYPEGEKFLARNSVEISFFYL